jgi:hypothetical protein
MSVSNRESISIVDKLIKLTQHNFISWTIDEPSEGMNSFNSKVDLVYRTFYLDNNMRIYENRYKYYIDDSQYVWNTDVVMDIVDKDDRVLWRFPYTPNMQELFKVIQFKNPVIQDFYDAILKDGQ